MVSERQLTAPLNQATPTTGPDYAGGPFTSGASRHVPSFQRGPDPSPSPSRRSHASRNDSPGFRPAERSELRHRDKPECATPTLRRGGHGSGWRPSLRLAGVPSLHCGTANSGVLFFPTGPCARRSTHPGGGWCAFCGPLAKPSRRFAENRLRHVRAAGRRRFGLAPGRARTGGPASRGDSLRGC
jgi:hypothetical protein